MEENEELLWETSQSRQWLTGGLQVSYKNEDWNSTMRP